MDELVCVPGDNSELVYSNPERTRYTEGVVGLRCSYKGTPGTFMNAMWVSKDWSMLFGNFMGWPKKIANIHLTCVPPNHPTLKPIGVGSNLRGVVAREGYRILDVIGAAGYPGRGLRGATVRLALCGPLLPGNRPNFAWGEAS